MSVSYNPSITTDGLILYLDPANIRSYSGSGTAWNTLIGSTNATLYNTPIYSTTNGGIFTFNGSNQYALVGALTSGLTTTMSINLWFKTTTTSVAQTLWWDDDGQGGGDAWVSIETTGKIQSNRNTDGYGVLASAATIATNTWYNFCMVADGTGKKFYINGALDTSDAVAIATRASRSYFSIAVSTPFPPTPSSGYFNGSMGPISVYSTALSAAAVATNFNATRGRYGI